METNYIKNRKAKGIMFYKLDDIEKQYDILPPGIYSLKDYGNQMTPFIPGFEHISLPDNLIKFKSGVFKEAERTLSSFLSQKSVETYKMLEIGHKLGTIMYGKPGTGKTCLAQLIMESLVEKYQAICLDCSNRALKETLLTIEKIRSCQQNPICIFIDEFDNHIINNEYGFLTFLDGHGSVNNMIFIGCTNYLDKIPDRIKNRKSRIKYLFEIASLPDEVYKDYLQLKIGGIYPDKVAEFVHYAVENKLTIDQLKHAMTDFVVDDKKIEACCRDICIDH